MRSAPPHTRHLSAAGPGTTTILRDRVDPATMVTSPPVFDDGLSLATDGAHLLGDASAAPQALKMP